ncbi:MAG: flavodoxin family protein [Chloroflexi bacterium]|nr:flavodoxin family protein [Chloroflexota bacterium]
MSKEVMIVLGTARKNGNTANVAQWVADGAREAGANVETIDASKLTVKAHGCLHCLGCQKSDEYRCVVGDGAASAVARMLEKDVIVFATPVYFGGVSAQLKQVIDRMYCLIKVLNGPYTVCPELKDISFALVATAGGDERFGLGMTSRHMKGVAAGLGNTLKELLVTGAPAEPGEIASNEPIKAKAMAFGRELVS